ncbi:MAG: hypothetical protein ACJ72E_00705 [Marmoricola sp.]
MPKISRKAAVTTVAASAALLVVGGVSGAGAAKLIDSSDIKNNSIQTQDVMNGSLRVADLRPEAVQGLMQHSKGEKGDKGDSGLKGAYYSVAYYDAGDTNSGAIATVACKSQDDVAISGGVQTLGLDADANSRNTPVSSSFPGRMNWSASPAAPFADRLDGWIVQFGGSAGQNPLKTKVWALCVPGASIPVDQTYTESD